MFSDLDRPGCGRQGKAPILQRLNSPIPVISNHITKHTQIDAYDKNIIIDLNETEKSLGPRLGVFFIGLRLGKFQTHVTALTDP